jgi:nucleoside phosphorylase
MTTSKSGDRIAILAQCDRNCSPLARLLSLKRSRSSDRSLYWGALGRVEIVATTTGIGTCAATQAAEKILEAIPLQHVVVIGIAGGVGPSVYIGGLVVPELVIDLATGAEYRPSVMGDTEARGTLATSNEVLSDQAEAACLERQGVIAVDPGQTHLNSRQEWAVGRIMAGNNAYEDTLWNRPFWQRWISTLAT